VTSKQGNISGIVGGSKPRITPAKKYSGSDSRKYTAKYFASTAKILDTAPPPWKCKDSNSKANACQ
jgi:hypothetical protein